MSMIRRLSILCCAMLLLVATAIAQVSPAMVEAELARRGLDRAEVEAAMADRGYSIDSIDPNNPTQMAAAKKALEEVFAELEAKKGEGQVKRVPAPAKTDASSDQSERSTVTELAEEVKDGPITIADQEVAAAVKDGATIEEAVADQLAEAKVTNLPSPTIYGQHLYRKDQISFYKKSTDAKPPETYVLGPGDGIAVEIWGVSEESMAFKINRDGYVKPPQMPRIYLAGLTIASARDLMRKRFDRYYRFRPTDFEISVSTARTVGINISGEVFSPGKYTISALNNAINALVAAGGPTDIGSVRRIKLLQEGKMSTVDLYQYLQDPSLEADYYLTENDYIIIPVAERVVTISGAVQRPFRYELLSNEQLTDLIDYAGGLRADAYTQNIKITRIEDNREIIVDVDLEEVLAGRSRFDLRNGDEIQINPIPQRRRNVVTANGAVVLPGDYAYREGMTIVDLLAVAEVADYAVLDRAVLKRLNNDGKTVTYLEVNLNAAMQDPTSAANRILQRGDVLAVRDKASFVGSYDYSISGAVRAPGNFQLDSSSITLSQAIFLADGLVDNAATFGYVLRRLPGATETSYININIEEAVTTPGGAADISIAPNDRVIVYSDDQFDEEFTIAISGAVKEETEMQYAAGIELRDLIYVAGGLTFSADRSRIDIFRLVYNDSKATRTLVANVAIDSLYRLTSGQGLELRPFDEVIVRDAPQFEQKRYVSIVGEVVYPGRYAFLQDNMRMSDLVGLAKGVTKEAFMEGAYLTRVTDEAGKVIIDLQAAMGRPGSDLDILLKKGDVLTIPKATSLVSIVGATKVREVYNDEALNADGSILLAYEGGKTAKEYINEYAGGFAENADRKRLTVTYPNGQIKSARRVFLWTKYPKVEPGSQIYTPAKPPKPEPVPGQEREKSDVDWGEVLANGVAQATAVLSLLLLIRTLD